MLSRLDEDDFSDQDMFFKYAYNIGLIQSDHADYAAIMASGLAMFKVIEDACGSSAMYKLVSSICQGIIKQLREMQIDVRRRQWVKKAVSDVATASMASAKVGRNYLEETVSNFKHVDDGGFEWRRLNWAEAFEKLKLMDSTELTMKAHNWLKDGRR